MGLVLNILLFTFCLSFSFWLLTGEGTVMTSMFSCMGTPLAESSAGNANNLTSQMCSASSIQVPFLSGYLNSLGIVVNGTLFGVILACFAFMVSMSVISLALNRFPDPWTWFSIAGIFVLAMATYPISLLNDLTGTADKPKYFPPELDMLLTGVFLLCYGISFLYGYKQGGST